jgi:acid phosphatase type 7
MFPIDRRGFFGLSALSAGSLFAADPEIAPKPKLVPSSAPVGGRDTLFLTYSGDPTTSVTIQWIDTLDPTADVAIRHAKTFGIPGLDSDWVATKTTTAPFPRSEMFRHRANLTGLTPGTEYRFRIGASGPTYRFRTMPKKATDAFTFISGGDCGVNEHVVANNKLAARQDPYFAVIGGDLAYDNGTSAKTFVDWLRNYSKTMTDTAGRIVPMVVCIGNHEVNGGFGKARKDAPFFFALFDGLYSDTSYAALDFGDYLSLVLLDTGHTAKIAGAQTDWLDKALAARVDRPHLIAVNHVPCYPSFRPAEGSVVGLGGTGTDQRKHWVPLFEKHNVDLVLEHHDHTFKRTHPLKGGLKDKYGVLYLGDGSWGKLRSAAKAESRSYIATASTSYHLTVHRLEAEQRFHMALEEGGKIVDVCRTEKKPRKRG